MSRVEGRASGQGPAAQIHPSKQREYREGNQGMGVYEETGIQRRKWQNPDTLSNMGCPTLMAVSSDFM